MEHPSNMPTAADYAMASTTRLERRVEALTEAVRLLLLLVSEELLVDQPSNYQQARQMDLHAALKQIDKTRT